MRRRKKNTPPLPDQPPLPLDFTPRKEEEPEKPYWEWHAYKGRYRPEPEYHRRWDDEEEEYDDDFEDEGGTQ